MIIGRISKTIAGGVGLGRESYLQHKKHKSEQAASSNSSINNIHTDALAREEEGQIDELEHGDAQIWALDDIGEQGHEAKKTAFENVKDMNGLVKAFMDLHPSAADPTDNDEQLPFPVCIPQRRPGHRTRGFVRAYAPDLQLVGIDQDTFLDFLHGFEKSITMQKGFIPVQLVVKAAVWTVQIADGFSVLLHAASFALHASVEAGRRVYISYKTNEYLDRMNQDFFRPHGLYAIIMCYKPKKDGIGVGDTTDEAVARRVEGNGSKFSRQSGTTKSELEIPQAAHLIFPDVDKLGDGKKPSMSKRVGAFWDDYYDRRGQADFSYNHPNSKLSVQEAPEFLSRYSDPNSAASTGGLIGLLSGGMIASPRYYLKQSKRKSKLQAGKSVAPRSKIISEDVLYLMVVNLPSDEEIAAAKRLLLREHVM